MRHFVAIIALGFASHTLADDAPVSVKVAKPEVRKLKKPVEQPGSVRADLEAPLAAKVTGYVAAVRVDIGDRVEKGAALVEFSVPELDEEVKQKQAVVRQMEVAVRQGKQSVETAKAQVTMAEALAKEAGAGLAKAEANRDRWASEARRMTALAKDVVDPGSREEAINQAKAAEAALEEARAKIASAAASVKRWQAEQAKVELDTLADDARLAVARADADRAIALQQYKTIKAPFAGVITRRLIDPGHLIQPGKPEVLLVIASTDKVRAAVDVPETDAALLKKGDPATVRVPALEGREFKGQVSRLSWSLDTQARTLRAEIDLDNKDDVLRPGMFVTTKIGVDLAPVKAVPAKALMKAGETQACFVVRDGKAVRVRVKAGRSDGNWTEVVEQQEPGGSWAAFRGDEPVIVAPPASLTDGQAVDVK